DTAWSMPWMHGEQRTLRLTFEPLADGPFHKSLRMATVSDSIAECEFQIIGSTIESNFTTQSVVVSQQNIDDQRVHVFGRWHPQEGGVQFLQNAGPAYVHADFDVRPGEYRLAIDCPLISRPSKDVRVLLYDQKGVFFNDFIVDLGNAQDAPELVRSSSSKTSNRWIDVGCFQYQQRRFSVVLSGESNTGNVAIRGFRIERLGD
ncbi:MAG: hypothetical protein AAFP90_19655, partial [Planctomycetota bacterium]